MKMQKEVATVDAKAVLFDLDDTLYDRFPAIRTYAVRYFQRDFQELLAPLDSGVLAELMVEADGGPLRSGKEAMQALQRSLPWIQSVPDWESLMRHWFTYFPLCSERTAEMEETLDTLRQRGFKLGVVTNGQGPGQNQKIDTLGIRPYLDAISISGEIGIKKPYAGIFQHALQQLNVNPRDVWFVGDNPVMDIYGAYRMGLTPIWIRRYDRPWHGPLEGPPQTVRALKEVLSIIDR
ncbi:MAG: hypothetical protein C7B43_11695 [Sulfobacillus benefaciens]|jgi:putative hydrolase of the HAD superfamily|uniref:HAD family hydrolase n=1 Tax=Sulfobacillus benefaciens TaxID=453960 RepID=A0A2T2WYV0_9FIRM|nr:MAG: hypothetical protein C7B43_11695 [Sulfobacillus benefaciens]HBQ96297.1 hypothetical protein [Sulfobacillus sp.]